MRHNLDHNLRALIAGLSLAAISTGAWAGPKTWEDTKEYARQQAALQAAQPTPPAWEQFVSVPYAKFINNAFAGDLEGQWIKVECTFVSAAPSPNDASPFLARSQGIAGTTDVFFTVNGPDAVAGAMVSNPLTGTNPAGVSTVYLAKEKSDPIFSLVAGQKVVLYGIGQKYQQGVAMGANAAATEVAVLHVYKIEASASASTPAPAVVPPTAAPIAPPTPSPNPAPATATSAGSVRLPRLADYGKATGRDEAGSCENAWKDAVSTLEARLDGTIFQTVDKDDQPTSGDGACELNNKGKASVQVWAYAIATSESPAYPELAPDELLKQLRAARSSRVLGGVGPFLRIDETGGRLWLRAGTTDAGKVVQPPGLRVEQRAAATYQNAIVNLGVLYKLARAVAAVPEVDGATFTAVGQYALDASQSPGELWDFRFESPDLAAFASGAISARDLSSRAVIGRRDSDTDDSADPVDASALLQYLPAE